MGMTFDQDFIFGTATASYQIEGGVHEGGRGRSIWDTFSHTPGKVVDGDTGDVACDHYHRWEEDLDILADLGVDAYRLSIAWPRIQPDGVGTPNQAGIDFYSRLIDGLLARDIKPLVTLYHWDLPQALEDKGGWLNRDTAYRFADYANIMGRALADRVPLWATLNEPWCAAMLGYVSGEHAPGRRSPEAGLIASHHLNLAHGLGVQALRDETSGKLGIVVNYHQFNPVDDSPEAISAVERLDAVGNWIYTDPILRGEYNPLTLDVTRSVSSWGFIHDGDLDLIHQPIDFVGHNYYAPTYIAGGHGPAAAGSPWVGVADVSFLPPRQPVSDMGWAIEPAGLTRLLTGFSQRYPGIDLIMAENGAAMPDVVADDGSIHDADRTYYIQSHISAIADAIAAGAPVKGYFVWSLLDNFEWAFGYSKRFGIIRVDYTTLARTWKDSARWYQQFLVNRTI
ncbi:MAG: beta-glucosidase [Propionibacteriaceae bacterium]|jgi:beta-glucosidase|nr:beta-glucosidase [Propionibacteriaceae bacterium]